MLSLRRGVGAATVVALVAVAGCDGPTPGEQESVSPSPMVSLIYGSAYPLPAEFAEWEQAYQQELEQLIGGYMDQGFLQGPPTDVQFVRFIRPIDFGSVHAECISEQGFPVSVTFDGGLEFGDVPPEQGPALQEATLRCYIQYPVHPKYAEPNEAQIRITYDYYVDELVPCLNANGYPVDPGTIPTWDVFLNTYNTRDGWAPYVAVEIDRLSPGNWEEWVRINETCPQSPPFERLWPEDA